MKTDKYRIVRAVEHGINVYYVQKFEKSTFYAGGKWNNIYNHTSMSRCEAHLNQLRSLLPPMVMKEYEF